MAKKRTSVNKSQAIRDALAVSPEKSPKEIAEALQAQGYKVNAQYVSTIKSNAKAKSGRRVMRRKPGRRAGGVTDGNGFTAALELIRSAGGIEQAKQILATVEQIKAAL